MKCHKCGYNSFEFLDSCKKCGAELGSFKKSHRIVPVIIPACSEAGEAAASGPSFDAVKTAPPVVDSANVEAGDAVSWDTPEDSADSNPYEGFALDFPDASPAETKDVAFSGFSFSDEPEAPPEAAMPETNAFQDEGFSFEELAATEQESPSSDVLPAEKAAGDYEFSRMLDLESSGDTGSSADGLLDEESGFADSFGSGDFSFDEKPGVNDMFQFDEEATVSATAEKKAQPNLQDFDKEFEAIFSAGDAADSEEMNR